MADDSKAAEEVEWRPVSGWEGSYEVSSAGRVRSLDRRARVSHGKFRPIKGELMKVSIGTDGYPRVRLWLNNNETSHKVHRLVLTAFVGPCPPEQEALHRNGNRTDARLENLHWGTRRENLLDKRAHGTDHNVMKTHCPHGHAYDEENTYVRPGGTSRSCRACHRIRSKSRSTAKKASGRPGYQESWAVQ